jgi:hypothetical protein
MKYTCMLLARSMFPASSHSRAPPPVSPGGAPGSGGKGARTLPGQVEADYRTTKDLAFLLGLCIQRQSPSKIARGVAAAQRRTVRYKNTWCSCMRQLGGRHSRRARGHGGTVLPPGPMHTAPPHSTRNNPVDPSGRELARRDHSTPPRLSSKRRHCVSTSSKEQCFLYGSPQRSPIYS